MAEEQALGTPSNHDPCANRCLDSQPPLNPAVVKPPLSSVAASPVSVFCSTSSSAISLSEIAPETATATNRCVACRKRVGLTGFRCRCGSTYCGAHRYPEKHGCEHDYKMAGREQIRRQNPIVVAEKLQKI